jgi:hypothetical protein
MTDAPPPRFPLAWPPGRPRRPPGRRVAGDFSRNLPEGMAKRTRKVNLGEAALRCEEEVERLGGRWAVLSTNVELRLDGRHKAMVPMDPGACLYFELKGIPHAMACDSFTEVEQNVAAIAAHLKAVRAIERYGVGSSAESLQAFAALPAPAHVKPARPWWSVLGVARDSVDAADVRAMFQVRAKKAHPDKGGSAEAMAELNVALAEALKELA